MNPSTVADRVSAALTTALGRPDAAAALVALLPENHPLYTGLAAADAARARGFVLAAFARTGLPDEAVPYLLAALRAGHDAHELAGAAVGLRGAPDVPAGAHEALTLAASRLPGRDATVSLDRPDDEWPYPQPNTASAEIARTAALLGSRRPAARPAVTLGMPLTVRRQPPLDVVLEDQAGTRTTFGAAYPGRPAVVAFFYTRCDNPYKCTVTITRLAAVQRALAAAGRADDVLLSAVTYDPDFDLPHRLRQYGEDRGVRFGDAARFFRAVEGFAELRLWLDLGVNYGAATVNGHATEVYVLDRSGRPVHALTRVEWEPAEVLDRLDALNRSGPRPP